MNWDRVEGNWKQITGKVKGQWGKLTEDDLTVINGNQDQLVVLKLTPSEMAMVNIRDLVPPVIRSAPFSGSRD